MVRRDKRIAHHRVKDGRRFEPGAPGELYEHRVGVETYHRLICGDVDGHIVNGNDYDIYDGASDSDI